MRWSDGTKGAAPPRRSLKAPLFLIFFALSLLLPLLKPFLTSKSPNTNPKLLDLQKNKNKRKRYHLYVLFGSVWNRSCFVPFAVCLVEKYWSVLFANWFLYILRSCFAGFTIGNFVCAGFSELVRFLEKSFVR